MTLWLAEERQVMKVFISWSGLRSKAVAETLRTWLKDVMQAVEPWVSRDIQKGTRWSHTLALELENTNVGVICLTPENLTEPWLLFEAGALSKLLKDTRVCTYLIDVEHSSISGPLAEFQHTSATRDETYQLVRTINAAIDEPGRLPDDTLNRAFNRCWPELDRRLKTLPALEKTVPTRRTDSDMLREVLEIVRDLAKSPPLLSARTLGELFGGLGPMGSFSDQSIRNFYDLHSSSYAPIAGRAGLIESLKSFIADLPEAKRVAAIEAFLQPPTPSTSKPETPQKKNGRRRRQ
jgi:hypothetical protein